MIDHPDFGRKRAVYGLRPHEDISLWKLRRPCFLFLVLVYQTPSLLQNLRVYYLMIY